MKKTKLDPTCHHSKFLTVYRPHTYNLVQFLLLFSFFPSTPTTQTHQTQWEKKKQKTKSKEAKKLET